MRTRPLKPSFWKNEFIVSCNAWARLLLQGLWMLADREGRLEYRPFKFKLELFPADDADQVKIEENLALLESKKLIEFYEVDGQRYIQIPNFAKHARPHHHEPVEFPAPTTKPGESVDKTKPVATNSDKVEPNPDKTEPRQDMSGHVESKCASFPFPSFPSPLSPLPSSALPAPPDKGGDSASPQDQPKPTDPKPPPKDDAKPAAAPFNPGYHFNSEAPADRVLKLYREQVTATWTAGLSLRNELARMMVEDGVLEDDLAEAVSVYAARCRKNNQLPEKRMAPKTFFLEGHWFTVLQEKTTIPMLSETPEQAAQRINAKANADWEKKYGELQRKVVSERANKSHAAV